MAGSAMEGTFFGMAGSLPLLRWGGAALLSESWEMSLRRSSFISAAGRYRPGSALALFSTQL